jgi:hypothetical protein
MLSLSELNSSIPQDEAQAAEGMIIGGLRAGLMMISAVLNAFS